MRWLCSATMSTQLTWLATNSVAPGNGTPRRRMRNPKMRISPPCHQRMTRCSSGSPRTSMRPSGGSISSSTMGRSINTCHTSSGKRRAKRRMFMGSLARRVAGKRDHREGEAGNADELAALVLDADVPHLGLAADVDRTRGPGDDPLAHAAQVVGVDLDADAALALTDAHHARRTA